MRRKPSRYIISMYRMPPEVAASRDVSDKSADVVSAALLKFTRAAGRLGCGPVDAGRLFGAVLATGQARRQRRMTPVEAVEHVQQLAAAVPLGGVRR